MIMLDELKHDFSFRFPKNLFENEWFSPLVAVDIVIFTVYNWELCVLINKPHLTNGVYTLPWSIVPKWQSLEESFDMILKEQTWISWVYKEQLFTFSDPKRDPRAHVFSVSYYALVSFEKFQNEVDLTKIDIVKFKDIDNIEFWYDHKIIIKKAFERLNFRIETTNIVKELMPQIFRFSQLQKMYELITLKEFDKRNFQKKVLSLWIIHETWNLDKTQRTPAKLYEFSSEEIYKL